jgi:acetoin utilization deacetylase AcuC-like enzyme
MGEEGYPVLAERVKPTYEYLVENGTLKESQISVEEPQAIDNELLLEVHTKGLVERVMRSSYDKAARISAGAAVKAGEAVWKGECQNAFAFTGCAGHHASEGSCWGFCYYNNSALLIRHLQKKFGVKRFLIVDTDPHFGDGTRNILGMDGGVYHLNFYATIGETPSIEIERHIDVPFPSTCGDISFVDALQKLTLPVARRSRAQMILWNMGHDAHVMDYGGFNLSLHAFPRMTDILLQAAEEICAGKLVVLLSGGSEAYVAKHAISSIIRRLAGLEILPADVDEKSTPDPTNITKTSNQIIDSLLSLFEKL